MLLSTKQQSVDEDLELVLGLMKLGSWISSRFCWQFRFFFVVWASSFNPLLGRTRSPDRCWAAIRLPHRPEQSGRAVNEEAMDWTLEDNIADGLFLWATLTGRKGGHILFMQAEVETPDTGAEAVKSDPRCFGRVIPGRWVPGMKVRRLVNLSTNSAFRWWSAQSAARMLLSLSHETMTCCVPGTNGCRGAARIFLRGGGWSYGSKSLEKEKLLVIRIVKEST